MRRSNYEPPMMRLLWWWGVDVPPPHFANFGRNLVFSGVPVGLGCAAGQFVANIILNKTTAVSWSACAVGLIYGFFMAAYYAYGARKHGIPRWHGFDGLLHGGDRT